jgi:hypothetical protein
MSVIFRPFGPCMRASHWMTHEREYGKTPTTIGSHRLMIDRKMVYKKWSIYPNITENCVVHLKVSYDEK